MILRTVKAGQIPTKRRAGFTLLEVVFASAVSAILLAGMFQGYRLAARRAAFSACSLAANSLAVQRMEQVISATWVPAYGETALLGMSATQAANLWLPFSQSSVSNCCVTTSVSNVTTSAPYYAMITVSCIWTFPNYGGTFTNTVAVLRAPNL